MGIPKDPRQAMINMMYLVLTALLALNVSNEVLNAFKTVNRGMERSVVNIEAQNELFYSSFADKAAQEGAKAKQKYEQALEVQKLANQTYDYLEQLKKDMLEMSGYETQDRNGKTFMVATSDKDINTAQLYMDNKGHGEELQKKVNEVRERLLSYYDTDVRDDKEANLPFKAEDPGKEEGANKDWTTANFHGVPIVAAQVIMTKLQNDLRTVEADLISYLFGDIDKLKLKFDQMQGRAVAKKGFVTTGETFEADMFVSAASSNVEPTIYVGSFDPNIIKRGPEGGFLKTQFDSLEAVPLTSGYRKLEGDITNGVYKYKETAAGEGPKTVTGVIEIEQGGRKTYFPFATEYLAARPYAVVSPTAMNVFYIGVDNPVEVSVPGVPARDVSVSMSGGTISGGNGKYTVRVTGGTEATVNVSAKTDAGTRSMGSQKFRVKRIPNPKVLLGNSEGGVIKSGVIRAMLGLVAYADNFPFDVKFNVRGFELTYKPSGSSSLQTETNNSGIFQSGVKALLGKASPGDRYWFDNIRVAAPDGTTRVVNLSYKVIGG